MALLLLDTWRDIVIIAAGSMMVLVLLAVFVITVVLGVAARALLGAVRTLLDDEVTPFVHSARQTAQKVRGTVTFVSETSVTPIVRVFSVVAGARRMVGVLTGISGLGKRRSKDDESS